jgi:translocation and assembly module TamA
VRLRVFVPLLLWLATAACAGDLPLVRVDAGEAAPRELSELLAKVVRSVEPSESSDAAEDERMLRRLRFNALEALATEGYFSPQIAVEPDATQKARQVLRVDPGPRAQVVEVRLRFTGAIESDAPRVRQLESDWELAVGKPFRDPSWSEAKTKLLNGVLGRDFPAARIVDSTADVDADNAIVRLSLEIDSGPAFTLGRPDISGLVRYDPQLVQRYNPFAPGDRYDAARLLEFQRRLQRSPYFSSVLVDVDVNGPSDDAPIRVQVTEAKTKRVAYGLGYSTDTGARLEVTYRQSLLFGKPYTLATGASVDPTRAVGFADILLPPHADGTVDSLGVLRENTDIENVLTRRWAMGVSRAHTRESGAVTYDTLVLLRLESELRHFADNSTPDQNNDVATATYTWTRKAVDRITDPTRGHLLTLSGTLGLRRDLQDNFVRLYARYLYYLPISPRDQVILRGEAGNNWVDDPTKVPNDYLFRTGGVGSVRGYSYQSLGVRQGTATIGSRSLLVGSAEYVRWLNPTWGSAAFCDFGDAADDLRDVRLARGCGVGARMKTAAGPLAVDLAYGERYKQWRLHFFIAIAY